MIENKAYNEWIKIMEISVRKLNIPKWFYPFFIGFIVGIFALIFMGELLLGENSAIIAGGLYNNGVFERLQNTNVNKTGLFIYILRKRFILFAILCCINRSRKKTPMIKGLLIYIGICSGISISTFILRMGIKGILFFVLSLIPHFVFLS